MNRYGPGRHKDRQHGDHAAAPLGPAAPGPACRVSCRNGPPRSIREPQSVAGSSGHQRLDHSRRQIFGHTRRDADANVPAKFDLHRQSTGRRFVARHRRNHYLGKSHLRGSKLLAPAVDLSRNHISAPGNCTNRAPRRKCLRHNRPFLILAPSPPSLRPGNQFRSAHRTISCIDANTLACTSAMRKPHQLRARKTADIGWVPASVVAVHGGGRKAALLDPLSEQKRG
jgi:hypothetical protein